jgi:predicted nucleic acid-binding protein
MPLYFLIDTNIWINELVGAENDSLIKWLEYLTQNEKIKLLVPATLMKEWKNQAKVKLKISRDKFIETGKIARQSEGVVSSLEDYMDRMNDREKRMTSMLLEGIQIIESDEVNKETMRRYHLDIAPFHLTSKSNADSLIYFSSVEFLKKNGIPGFVFLTSNHTDFGAIN